MPVRFTFVLASLQVLSLLIGGGMALKGIITAQQLTTFVLYVEFVTYASLNVCDQWGSIMESIGASERVMEFLDKPCAPQLAAGRVLPNFSGTVRPPNAPQPVPGSKQILDASAVLSLDTATSKSCP